MAELDRRDFVKLGAATAAGAGALVGCAGVTKESAPPTASTYEAEVPDTLDLAERARLSVNSLTGAADLQQNCETFQCLHFDTNPAYFTHNTGGPCLPKAIHVLPLMRKMSGSTLHADYDGRMVDALLTDIDENGLWWLRYAGRPSREGFPNYGEDVYWPFPHARLMVALMAWHEFDNNPKWLKVGRHLAEGLQKVARQNEQRAWFTNNKPTFLVRAAMAEEFEDLAAMGEGKKPTGKGGSGPTVEEPDKVNFQVIGNPLRALSLWAGVSGDEEALELARKTARFMLKPTMWGSSDGPTMIAGPEHAHWEGHFHTRTTGVMGMVDYAIIANDYVAKHFVRHFYEYTRNAGIGRIGFFPAVLGPLEKIQQNNRRAYGGSAQVCETCSIGDMVYIACRLSQAGIGDYWDDVDQYVRNHLVESQLLRRDLIEKIIETAIEHPLNPEIESGERVIERGLGGFASVSDPTMLHAWWTMCCNANAPVGLYEAWNSIVQYNQGLAQVNLLLNRASPWVDIDSYLPYEGKVGFKIKTAKKLSVRIPTWADKRAVRCQVNQKSILPAWSGNYVLVDRLQPSDEVTLTFPMVETTEYHTAPTYEIQYTCRFKGNTLVDISPRPDKFAWKLMASDDGAKIPVRRGYPLYLREFYKGDKAPMKKISRYVHPV